MNFSEKINLGNTALKIGRLGISSSYGAPAKAFEEAFERGCNYWNWGTFIKGRSKEMRAAVRNIVKNGKRDELVLGMISYAHNAWLMDHFFKKGLKQLGTDYADVLIIGYYSKRPQQSLIDKAMKMKEEGRVRHLALTSHQRKVYLLLDKEKIFDIFHIRYNAVNKGAEVDTFPKLRKETGVITFTATAWKKLLNPKKMPQSISPCTAADCYRFVLSNPSVHACMMGANNIEMMRENLKVLETGPMNDEEINKMRMVGDYIYKK